MTIERTVFGISPGLRGRFAFVPVAATVSDRRLSAVTDPGDEFPTEGNFYVDESYGVPSEGVGAIWRVRSGGAYSADRKHAEFSAFARGREGPLEIISIPVSSSAPNGVRKCLCEGVELGYVSASNVLVRLEDGVVIGPVRTKPWFEERALGLCCPEESFSEPFSLWDDASRLEPFWVDDASALTRKRRRFVSYLDLPEPQSYFDAAAFADCVKSVFKAVQIADPSAVFSKRQLAELTRAIAEGALPERLRARASRVLGALRSASLSRDELEAVLPAARENAEIREELAKIRETTAQDERQRIRSESTNELARLNELKAQIGAKEAQSHELEKRIAEGRAGVEASINSVAAQVGEKLREVLDQPERLFADVAILRPLLNSRVDSPSPASRQDEGNLKPDQATARKLRPFGAPGKPPEDFGEVLAAVENGLRVSGLLAKPARSLSREVVAALATGQIPMFRGSVGRLVARSVAQALCGECAYVLPVPVGALNSEFIARALDDLENVSVTTTRVAALVIEGIDRSPIEVYGDEILQVVAERVMGLEAGRREIVLLGVMSGGPGALPISDALCDLGPIIHTDAVGYSRNTKMQPFTHVGMSCDVWLKTATGLLNAGADGQSEVLAIATKLGIIGSAMWRRGVEIAGHALTAANPDDRIAPAESLISDWLIPRALAEGSGARFVSEQSRLAAVELDVLSDANGESRLSRLLARLEREDGDEGISSILSTI